jgi:hypothetical protein
MALPYYGECRTCGSYGSCQHAYYGPLYSNSSSFCMKCGYSMCRCVHQGPIFPAKYAGPCLRCEHVIFTGEAAQFIDNKFGHPVGQCKPDLTITSGAIRPKKETEMDRLDRKINAVENELVALLERKERITEIGEDVYENESVLMWNRKFTGSRKAYTYIAVKADDVWYVTGSRQPNRSYTWDDLVEEHLVNTESVWVVTEMEEL